MKGFKRSNLESALDLKPRKVKNTIGPSRHGQDTEVKACVTAYKFVDKGNKLQSQEIYKQSASSQSSSKSPTPDWTVDKDSGAETPPSSVDSDVLEKIDPQLLVIDSPPGIVEGAAVQDVTVEGDIISLDKEKSYQLGVGLLVKGHANTIKPSEPQSKGDTQSAFIQTISIYTLRNSANCRNCHVIPPHQNLFADHRILPYGSQLYNYYYYYGRPPTKPTLLRSL